MSKKQIRVRQVNDFLSVTNEAGGDSFDDALEINIHDRIGGDWFSPGVKSGDLKCLLDTIPPHKHIVVSLNSMGGDVSHGTAIHNMLKMRGDKVQTRVDGMAASMAGVIHQAGAIRKMMRARCWSFTNPSNDLGLGTRTRTVATLTTSERSKTTW